MSTLVATSSIRSSAVARAFVHFSWTLWLGVASVLNAQTPAPASSSANLILHPTWGDSNSAGVGLALPAVERSHAVRWWEAAAVLWAAVGLTAADEKVTHEFREHPTGSADRLAGAFRRVGQPEVYAALPLGVLATGLATDDARITRAGGRLAASVVASTLAFHTLKLISGRARPDAGQGPYAFHPFSGRGGFPSGHSTVAFALATSLADDLRNRWAGLGLYAIAAGTAWSRVYNERHWATDVVVGAALGITTSKVVSGRWRVFGLRAPRFLLEPGGAGLAIPIRLNPRQ